MKKNLVWLALVVAAFFLGLYIGGGEKKQSAYRIVPREVAWEAQQSDSPEQAVMLTAPSMSVGDSNVFSLFSTPSKCDRVKVVAVAGGEEIVTIPVQQGFGLQRYIEYPVDQLPTGAEIKVTIFDPVVGQHDFVFSVPHAKAG